MKFIFLLLTVACFLSPVGGLNAAPATPLNGIAVIVNDAVITIKDVQLALSQDVEALERRYSAQPQVLDQKLKQLQEDRLEELVEYQLILDEFKKAGFVLPESFIQARINEDIKKYGDRLTLTKTLQAQGLTFESYRTRIREKTIIETMWRQKVPRDPLISPAKIESYYADHRGEFKMEDQIKLRMIVLPKKPNEEPGSTTKLAREIISKIDQGAPFADMAKIYSQGSQAADGGDWGWVEKSVLRPELGNVAFGLKAGQHSDVIELPDTCFIMLVEEARVAHIKSLSEVRDVVEAVLKSEENKRLRKQWIERLKTKSFVQYF